MNFEESLKRIPPPGDGTGCHPYLMTCANIAIREGIEEDVAVKRIHAAVPKGNRVVSEREVRDTVRKSITEKALGRGVNARPTHGMKLKSLRMTTAKMLDKFLHPEKITIDHFLQASPIVFDPENYIEQAVMTLYHLFDAEDKIFVGDVYGKGDTEIWPRDVWINSFTEGDPECFPPHIIWNPLTGRHAKTSDGKDSLRCDNAVSAYKYTLVEFDSIDIDTQLKFWAGCKLPVAALVYSGSKSIHGILKVTGVSTLDDWRHQIQLLLYKRWLAPLGVDPACSNVSRLSRLPGAWRENKDAYQKLLYLNPNATALYLEV